jgi:hypothetical protein
MAVDVSTSMAGDLATLPSSVDANRAPAGAPSGALLPTPTLA